MFFTVVYVFSSLILRIVLSIIGISILFILYLSPILALGISLLLVFKIVFSLDSIVIKLSFILKAIYNYFLIG